MPEVDCVQKLKHSNKRKKLNLLVIRCMGDGGLGNAKPCQNCLNTVSKTIKKKGYRLHRIYYSNTEGNICHLK